MARDGFAGERRCIVSRTPTVKELLKTVSAVLSFVTLLCLLIVIVFSVAIVVGNLMFASPSPVKRARRWLVEQLREPAEVNNWPSVKGGA